MADFYKVLRKTVEALPVATGQARRSVYDRARMALGGQLDAMNPPLPPSEVSRQRLGLEDSIRSVEEDYVAGKIITNSERENAERVAKLEEEEAAFRAQRSSRQVHDEAENMRRAAPIDDAVAFDVPAAAAPQPRRRQASAPEPAVAPRAAPSQRQAPEPRLEPAPSQSEDPSMAAFDAAVESARSLGEPSVRSAPGSGRREPDIAPEPRLREPRAAAAQQDGQSGGLSRRRGRDDYYDAPSVDDPYMDDTPAEQDDYYDDEPRLSAGPSFDDEPAMAAANDTRGEGRGGRGGRSGRGRGGNDYYDDRQDNYEPIRKKRRIWPWLLVLILLGGLGAGGFWAFQNKEDLMAMAEKWLDYGDGDVNPLKPAIGDGSAGEGPRRVNANGAPNGEAETPKNDGRIIDDSGQMNPDVERGDTAAAVGEGVLPQAAILYEEGPTAEESRAVRGGTSWRIQEQEGGLPVIIGRVEVPARRLSVDLTIRKNEDASLSASHLVEMSFAAPPQAVGGGIEDVPALLLKSSEEAQGELMASVSVKVSDTLFWIALSAAAEDVSKNLELLGSRTWFDLPVRYKNGRRAIITLEKGREGDVVFSQALEAWNRAN